MLVNLSDVLTSEGWISKEEIQLEMDSFESGSVNAPLTEKTPVMFTFTNVEKGRARIQGSEIGRAHV